MARTGMADEPTLVATVSDKTVELIEPLFVRPLVKIESGRNDSNPVWFPQSTFIAFERSIGDKKEIGSRFVTAR